MKISFLQNADAWAISLTLLLIMMFSIWMGIMIGRRIAKKQPSAIKEKESSLDISSLTGLLFFLLAFTFGMSGSRYESRKGAIVEEANDIGTALLRADLYSDEERNAFRADFKEYLEARIAYFENLELKRILAADSLAQVISFRIWQRATRLAKDPTNLAATQQMIPALNTMIDITTTRMAGEKAKVPESIVWMLFILACICSFFMGYASVPKGKFDWLVGGGFCLLISLVVLITLDLDRTRRGFINLKATHQTIIDLRKNFK